MDTFVKNRTYLVITLIILLFAFFFCFYFNKLFKETFRTNTTFPSLWNYGASIYIDNKDKNTILSTIQTPIENKNFKGYGECHEMCMNQKECIDEGENWKNECSSDYVNGDCFCKFQKVDEEFSVMKEYKNILEAYPNSAKPSWRDINSQNKWISLNKNVPVILWKNVKVTDINNMSLSFWIYFKEVLDRKRNYFTELFSIKTNNTIHLVSGAMPKRPVLNFAINTDSGMEYDKSPYTHRKDMTGGYEIGYDHRPSLVVLTITSGKVDFYLNGEWKNSFGENAIIPPKKDSTFQFGSNGKSILLKDFKFYNQSMTATNIATLYKHIENEGHFKHMQQRNNTIESFQNMPFDTFATLNDKFQIVTNWFHSKKESFVSSPIVVNESKIGLDSCIFRSETEQKCNKNKDATIRANEQKSPYHNTYHIDKAYMMFSDDSRQVDFTKEVRSVLETEPHRVGDFSKFGINEKKKLYIEITHPWTKKTTTFHVEYIPGEEFSWKNLSDKIKCINSDDNVWDDSSKKCTETGSHLVCSSNESRDCINYTAFKRIGRCSAANKPELKQNTIVLANGNHRVIDYVELHKEKQEYLEINISQKQEKNTMFTNEGTTIVMWVKIDPSMRNQTDKWCTLLNFGNRNWTKIEDEILIAIGNDKTYDNLIFRCNDDSVKHLGTQILDNKWHHIAWVLKPDNEEEKEKASWTIYHNGINIGTKETPYPRNKTRNTKMIGGPAVHSSPFWNLKMGELYIYGKALDEKIIDSIYQYGVR